MPRPTLIARRSAALLTILACLGFTGQAFASPVPPYSRGHAHHHAARFHRDAASWS